MLITRQSTRLDQNNKNRGQEAGFSLGQTKRVQKEKIQTTTRTEVLEQVEAIKAAVSEFPAFVPTLNKYLSEKCNRFTAGGVAQFLPKWKQITSDTNIISDISGVKIEFDTHPVKHNFKQTKFAPEEEAVIRSEISSLSAKQVIEPAEHEPGEIISNTFLRPKKDGSHRLILNLKELNQSVSYVHFKMETLSSILKLVEQNAFMAAIDLKTRTIAFGSARKIVSIFGSGGMGNSTSLPVYPTGCQVHQGYLPKSYSPPQRLVLRIQIIVRF